MEISLSPLVPMVWLTDGCFEFSGFHLCRHHQYVNITAGFRSRKSSNEHHRVPYSIVAKAHSARSGY